VDNKDLEGKTKKSLIVRPFEQYTERYEKWFDNNRFAYLSELEGIKSLLSKGKGIEIGVGTGRFAGSLSIQFGVDPSISMLKRALKRGIKVAGGVGEHLPVADNSFDFVLITTTLCFLKDIEKTLTEIKRILKRSGNIILAFIDRNSFLGKRYIKKKENNPFYKFAKFYSVEEVTKKLAKTGFSNPEIKQTLFSFPEELNSIDDIKDGYGKGGFVIMRMRKTREV
jgi:ubiquinone/menaquinone biosynthesis C-methylase UbiE